MFLLDVIDDQRVVVRDIKVLLVVVCSPSSLSDVISLVKDYKVFFFSVRSFLLPSCRKYESVINAG